MKKLLAIIVLGLLFGGNANADILLKDCGMFIPAGKMFNERTLNEDRFIRNDEDDRHEYFISFEDSSVYYTDFTNAQTTDAMNTILSKPTTMTKNNKFIITFADEKLITAKGKSIIDPSNPELYTTIELAINLENGEVNERHGAETYQGMQLLKLQKKLGYENVIYKCEFDKSKNNDKGKGSSGTAFFISNKGYLLTNNHVVEGCKAQKINYFNKEYDAQIIATDKNLDLALLKVDTKNNNYINFSKNDIEKLQKIYVAGYPFGKGLSDDLKVSSGIISSNKGFEDNSNEFQIDAPINPGNSGGPIVNDTGELVGIAVAGFAKDKSEGINFGIKSSTARTFLNTNKVKPGSSYMTFAMNNKKLLNLLEESTVYTFCD
jgi:S1-C subfamily serine protease